MVAPRVLAAVLIGSIVVASPGLHATQPQSQEEVRIRTRDAWQRPAEVLDALDVRPGSRVVDVGSGSGYFTVRLAERVGEDGAVYAVDVDRDALNRLRARVERAGLTQVHPIHGDSSDPHLPPDLDAALIVDAYHEFRNYDAMLQAVHRALVPGGRLVIIDGDGPADRPRAEYHRLHRIPAALVQEEVVRQGFTFKGQRPGFHDAAYGKQMYFLVFEKPTIPNSDRARPSNLD
jgi:predicted methyltransferase